MVTEGSTIVPGDGSVFIAKFCFSFDPEAQESGVGHINVTIRAPSLDSSQALHLVLFDDEPNSYPTALRNWDTLTCREKMRHVKQSHRLTEGQKVQTDGQLVRFAIVQRLRPRWWYVALAECTNSSVAIEYKVHATNAIYGRAEEFSTDRKLVLYVFPVLAVVYGCLAAAQLHANAVLAEDTSSDSASSKAAHPFTRLLTVGILLGFCANAVWVVHNERYVHNGSGIYGAHVLAQVLYACSNFVLASMLLLVSQGKCVSYMMVRSDATRMCKLLGPFLVSCLVLELWGDYSELRKYTTDYVYATPFGWAIILVDLLLLAVYAKGLRATLAAEGNLGNAPFYRSWGVLYGMWFLALPVTAVLSQAVLCPYAWYIVSVVVTKAMTGLMYAALVVGLWPENKRTYFKLTLPNADDSLESCASPPARANKSAAVAHLDRFAPDSKLNSDQWPRLLGVPKEGYAYAQAKCRFGASP